MVNHSHISVDDFKKLASEGLNCKQIAKRCGYSYIYYIGKIKKLLGMYPSIYIAGLKKNGRRKT
jgi:hypothetical protein